MPIFSEFFVEIENLLTINSRRHLGKIGYEEIEKKYDNICDITVKLDICCLISGNWWPNKTLNTLKKKPSNGILFFSHSFPGYHFKYSSVLFISFFFFVLYVDPFCVRSTNICKASVIIWCYYARK